MGGRALVLPPFLHKEELRGFFGNRMFIRVVFFYAGSKVRKECRDWQSALELVWLLRSYGFARCVLEPLASLELKIVGGTFGEGL